MEKEKKEEEYLSELDVLEDDGASLVLHNDDYHTFDYVILALEEICGHTTLQAEQCTMMVHCKGKCVVKKGSYEDLMPMHQALLDRKLTSEVIK